MAGRYEIPGSRRTPLPNAAVVGDVDPNERFLVTILLKRGAHPAPGHRLTREEYATSYGADSKQIAAVEQFARDNGLTVAEASPARHTVVLSGTASQFSAAFGVTLRKYRAGDVTYRGREGSVSVPAELQDVVQAVLGLDNRPQAEPHVQPAAAPAVSYSPPQVASLYDFPTGLDGTGECIAIIELGGGYTQSDLDTYFQGLGLTTPTVNAISVDGGTNAPGQDADLEVNLDIDVAGSIAPKATLAVYFAPNTDQGFIDAVTTAVHDTTNKPSIISISWGGPESTWTSQAISGLNDACSTGATLGVTIFVASGDSGSSDGVTDGLPHVDFPASSPYVFGCGGTTLESSQGTITSEVAWSDSGGGVSTSFPLPTRQSNSGVPLPTNSTTPGRGVPDVSGNADPNTGYNVRSGGQNSVVGGTSAVAPLWAGLFALINQKLGKAAGFANPTLYSLPGYPGPNAAIRDITSGSNGAYSAGTGWDAVTGLGSPDGNLLSQNLTTAS